MLDNAFDPGVVLSQCPAYKAIDVTFTGRTGHPGKDLSQTVNALEIFRKTHYPFGSLANDQTRISIGRIWGGSARNAIPAKLVLEGEIRSFESPERIQQYDHDLQLAFEQTAQQLGGSATITFTTHTDGYTIGEHEPLLQAYKAVLEQRGATLRLQPTFIGSDTSGFRPKIQAFTLSTGVMKEHSAEEYISLAPLEQIVQDTLQVLRDLL